MQSAAADTRRNHFVPPRSSQFMVVPSTRVVEVRVHVVIISLRKIWQLWVTRNRVYLRQSAIWLTSKRAFWPGLLSLADGYTCELLRGSH